MTYIVKKKEQEQSLWLLTIEHSSRKLMNLKQQTKPVECNKTGDSSNTCCSVGKPISKRQSTDSFYRNSLGTLVWLVTLVLVNLSYEHQLQKRIFIDITNTDLVYTIESNKKGL